jgi:hypothetical protein
VRAQALAKEEMSFAMREQGRFDIAADQLNEALATMKTLGDTSRLDVVLERLFDIYMQQKRCLRVQRVCVWGWGGYHYVRGSGVIM